MPERGQAGIAEQQVEAERVDDPDGDLDAEIVDRARPLPAHSGKVNSEPATKAAIGLA